jgi:hypothetical protein
MLMLDGWGKKAVADFMNIESGLSVTTLLTTK